MSCNLLPLQCCKSEAQFWSKSIWLGKTKNKCNHKKCFKTLNHEKNHAHILDCEFPALEVHLPITSEESVEIVDVFLKRNQTELNVRH